jgi:cysteinyl-tRNA synthetase
VSNAPDEVVRLAEKRDRARQAKDYAAADELRARIRDAGFEITDSPSGFELSPIEAAPPKPPVRLSPSDVESVLDQPAAFDATVQWIAQGWPEDILRGIESFDRHAEGRSLQHVVVDALEDVEAAWPDGADVVRLNPSTGWAAARNAGLTRSLGRIVVVVDGSVEARGDVIGPLAEALTDDQIGVTGPFGIITEELHHFHESSGPDVDAIEGYVMAVRRDLLKEGLRFDEKFKFYRTADIELSFQVKSRGLRAVVTPVPVGRHEHRMWSNTPEDERERLSKRNFYRFLDRWRGRTDLTVAGSSE